MPGVGQKSVTIPDYVYRYAQQYFESHKEELRKKGIKSVTKLISIWIQEAALQREKP